MTCEFNSIVRKKKPNEIKRQWVLVKCILNTIL